MSRSPSDVPPDENEQVTTAGSFRIKSGKGRLAYKTDFYPPHSFKSTVSSIYQSDVNFVIQTAEEAILRLYSLLEAIPEQHKEEELIKELYEQIYDARECVERLRTALSYANFDLCITQTIGINILIHKHSDYLQQLISEDASASAAATPDATPALLSGTEPEEVLHERKISRRSTETDSLTDDEKRVLKEFAPNYEFGSVYIAANGDRYAIASEGHRETTPHGDKGKYKLSGAQSNVKPWIRLKKDETTGQVKIDKAFAGSRFVIPNASPADVEEKINHAQEVAAEAYKALGREYHVIKRSKGNGETSWVALTEWEGDINSSKDLLAFLETEAKNHSEGKSPSYLSKDRISIMMTLMNQLLILSDVGIIHKDVKPDNIIFDEKKKELRLVDFNSAARIGEAFTLAGTPFYFYKSQPIRRNGKYYINILRDVHVGADLYAYKIIWTYMFPEYFMARGIDVYTATHGPLKDYCAIFSPNDKAAHLENASTIFAIYHLLDCVNKPPTNSAEDAAMRKEISEKVAEIMQLFVTNPNLRVSEETAAEIKEFSEGITANPRARHDVKMKFLGNILGALREAPSLSSHDEDTPRATTPPVSRDIERAVPPSAASSQNVSTSRTEPVANLKTIMSCLRKIYTFVNSNLDLLPDGRKQGIILNNLDSLLTTLREKRTEPQYLNVCVALAHSLLSDFKSVLPESQTALNKETAALENELRALNIEPAEADVVSAMVASFKTPENLRRDAESVGTDAEDDPSDASGSVTSDDDATSIASQGSNPESFEESREAEAQAAPNMVADVPLTKANSRLLTEHHPDYHFEKSGVIINGELYAQRSKSEVKEIGGGEGITCQYIRVSDGEVFAAKNTWRVYGDARKAAAISHTVEITPEASRALGRKCITAAHPAETNAFSHLILTPWIAPDAGCVLNDDTWKEIHALPLNERFCLMMSLIQEINLLHQKGFVHMDIKPENIIFDRKKGTLHLIDFGRCEKLDAPSGLVKDGTYAYRGKASASDPTKAGELLEEDKHVGADLYAFGKIFAKAFPEHFVAPAADKLPKAVDACDGRAEYKIPTFNKKNSENPQRAIDQTILQVFTQLETVNTGDTVAARKDASEKALNALETIRTTHLEQIKLKIIAALEKYKSLIESTPKWIKCFDVKNRAPEKVLAVQATIDELNPLKDDELSIKSIQDVVQKIIDNKRVNEDGSRLGNILNDVQSILETGESRKNPKVSHEVFSRQFVM